MVKTFLQSSAFPSKKPVGRVNSEQDVDRIRENMILNPKISHRTQCWWSAYRAGGFTVEEGLVITGRQHTRGKYLGERAEIANVWCGRKYKYEGLVSGIVLPTFCKRSRCKSTSTSEPATKI